MTTLMIGDGSTIGPALKDIRKQRGQTLAEVAAVAGVSISFLSDIEHGRTLPSIPTLGRLVDCYGIVVHIAPTQGEAMHVTARAVAMAGYAFLAGLADPLVRMQALHTLDAMQQRCEALQARVAALEAESDAAHEYICGGQEPEAEQAWRAAYAVAHGGQGNE